MRRQVFKISIGQILLILILIIALVSVVTYFKGDKEENNIEVKQQEENLDEEKNSSEIVEDITFEDNTLAHGDLSSTFPADEEDLLKEELTEDEILYITNVSESEDGSYILTGTLYEKYMYTASEIRYAAGRGYVTLYGEKYNMYESDVEDEYDLYKKGEEELIYKIRLKTTSTYFLESQLENADCWKQKDETYRVKVAKDIEVENSYGGKYTAEEVFGNMENGFPENTTHPTTERTFRFEFSNGICLKVIDVLT